MSTLPHRSRRASALLAAASALALLLGAAGCGGGDDTRTLRVYAAASLQAPFDEVAAELERRHDDVAVEVSYAGSSDLVAQLEGGARGDVLATADTATMDRAVADGLAEDPAVFATNTLTLAVPPGNPAGITGLADLARDDLAVVVCAPQVPCGAAAQRLADLSGVRLAPDSEEQSVTDVLGKVASGEADAGLVYVTDVLAAGDRVDRVEVPQADEVVNDYPVAVLTDAEHAALANELVDLVLGATGRRTLERAGFGPPR